MRTSLTFRLYMMRYGMALLASTFTHGSRPTFSGEINRNLASYLCNKTPVPERDLKSFRDYIFRKPGSPRYSPIRRALETGKPVQAERQDLLLADRNLPSSVGALTQDYFEDALSLAHILKLVQKDHNFLLARGRLSLSTNWRDNNLFRLGERDALFLGLWLLDADCDWIWAFLLQLSQNQGFEISTHNRVDILLDSLRQLLSSRQIRSPHANYVKAHSRITKLIRITERNYKEKLNLGQPWSWFLIPRLELLVDAGILQKKERHGLTGYSLTEVGRRMRSVCELDGDGQSLIQKYFSCRNCTGRPFSDAIVWEEVEEILTEFAPVLRTQVGYFPIFETASALCVARFLGEKDVTKPIWEIEHIIQWVRREARTSKPRIRLGIDRQGQIYSFKIR